MTTASPAVPKTTEDKTVLATPAQLHQTTASEKPTAAEPTTLQQTAAAAPQVAPQAAPQPETATRDSAMGKTMAMSNSILEGQRPSTPRAQSDPTNSFEALPTHNPRPRNRSPYSRIHLRSYSGSSAPPMTRAHSLPTVISTPTYLSLFPTPLPGCPASPLRSPNRTRSPRIQPVLHEDSYAHSGAPSVCDISEDAELELNPKNAPIQPSPLSGLYSNSGSLSRRRRPASPLHQVAFGTSFGSPAVRTPTSGPPSPLLSSAKFNECFPGPSSHYSSSLASSSVPSTPTSMRSRSPSISSLETIADTPDAEVEAIEADRIAKLKAAADRESEGEEDARRSSLDVPGGSGRTFGFGKRDSRKRWSVCGAERRQDLDLETIWED
ncbi:hypothetical protein P280DRAFT_487891 [Massarina eburnea CBS 473.64]|uniref:Basic proline-rich protein n=1 Tax=Massarina eburnea CBS 473.64 TaxID=1395130 RepID=A0A6A6SCY5_9PLEO|nr:hypothetical protein P280DRAFT_487891 [Massarina eburnea CBS 473.64]